ncbi:carnitine dehydratase, partial [Actinomadura sp. KC345]|uniref:CoA transferase n=1 Tax=Actinomadura sp. KC345 TaxID=2530371 RepID=UPI0010EAF6F5
PAAVPCAPSGDTPLAGVRVVESTNRVQGPLAGHLLHLLGAEIVRLEPPGGDPMRGVPPLAGDCSARFLALNRGKGAVEADLKTGAGREAALRLLASSDVFLQNWPPGRASLFELDAGDLAAVRPGLVYAHAGGWADVHPAPQPMGTDYLVQAYTGVAAALAADGQAPAPTLMTITDVLGALIGAEGTVAGLLARARGGTGVRVETGLVDAARLLLGAHTDHPRTDHPHTDHPHTDHRAGATAPTAPVVTDLAAMVADPVYERLFETGAGAAYSRSPWTFTPQPPHRREDA